MQPSQTEAPVNKDATKPPKNTQQKILQRKQSNKRVIISEKTDAVFKTET